MRQKRPGISAVIVIVAALVIILGIIVFPIIIVGTYLGGGLDKATGAVGATLTSSECITPLYPPVADEQKFAAAIDTYVAKLTPSSPFVGMGKVFVDAGKSYGINPAWVVNIARKESSFGIHIPPNSNNAFGRTATSEQPGVELSGRKWYRYDSFEASIPVQTEYLKRRYIDQGLVTIETITNVYAPPSENSTGTYIEQMKEWIGRVMALAGNGVTCPGSAVVAIKAAPTILLAGILKGSINEK